MPWDMERLTFEELAAIDAAVEAMRNAQVEAARPSRQ